MAKDAHPAAKADAPIPPRQPVWRRLLSPAPAFYRWLRARPLRGAIVGSAMLVTVIGIACGLTLALRPDGQPSYMRRLAQAFAKLDAGELSEARRLAAAMLTDSSVPYQDRGGAYYILGAITFQEAEAQASAHKRQLLKLVASRYLDEARNRGIPPPRDRKGLLLLGQALHGAACFDRCIPILRQGLQASPEDSSQLHALLADCNLKQKPPRLTDALEHHRQYIASAGLKAEAHDAALLAEARILLAQRDSPAAIAAVSKIGEVSPLYAEAVVLKCRAQLEAAADPNGSTQAAEAIVEELRQLQDRPGLPPEITGQTQFLTGFAKLKLGDSEAAAALFDRTRQSSFGQPEAKAATVLLASLLNRSNPQAAIALFKQTLEQVPSIDAYQNDWLSAEDLQKHAEVAIDELVTAERLAGALELAQALAPPFPRILAVSRQAEIHQAWARRLEDQARKDGLAQAGVIEAEARQQWREAGADYRQLAELRMATRNYLDDMGRSADCFRRGHGYEQAAAVYRDLLRMDPERGRPEALAGLGECLLTLGQTDAALEALSTCRDSYSNHPVAYRARLLASIALQDQGKLTEAKELLIDNLYRFSLAPQSRDWQDSLFTLGALLYREAIDLESRSRLAGVDRTEDASRQAGLALLEQSHTTFDEAVRTLHEAVQRYPAASQALEARYRIAEANRHSAKWPRKRLLSVTIETSRASLTRQMQEHLQAAVDEYNGLITRLSERPDANRAPTESAILRNCYFGRADALFDLERYSDAIAAYSAATNRYQHDPESLEAYVQIASCYRRLNRLNEARGTIDQARAVLQRIRPDADFTRTTRLAQDDWARLLDWLRLL